MSIIFNDITASLQKIVGTLWNGDGTFSKIPVIRQKSKAFDSEKVGAHKYHLRYNLSVRSIFCKNIPSRVFFSCTLFDQKKKNNITLSKKCTITSQILPYMYLLNAVSDWLTLWLADWITDWSCDWLTDWLADMLTDWLAYQHTVQLTGSLVQLLIGCFTDKLINWLTVTDRSTEHDYWLID